MPAIKILVSRHSAFYSPLIAAIAGGFLEAEGLDAAYGVLPTGSTSREVLQTGEAHVVQSAVSSNWGPMEKGIANLPVHFAQINRRDGFFLATRKSGDSFEWKNLEGATLLADHGGQPLAMLKYAAHYNGVDWSQIQVIDAGAPGDIEHAFREGEGDYAHLQGPAPQQLAHYGMGVIAASVGASMPEVAFSSLTALPEFLEGEMGQPFLRAFGASKRWVQDSDAHDVARSEASFFPLIVEEALAAAISHYQRLGCWEGGIEIPRDLYEQSLNVFEHSALITRRHPYDQVVRVVA